MLREWIKNILVCSVLFSVMLHIAPDAKLRRYVQIAVGFVMMVVAVSPLTGLLSVDDRMEYNLYEESLGMDISESDNSVYETCMEGVVERFVADRYGGSCSVSLTLDESLGIEQVVVTFAGHQAESADRAREVTAAVADEYGIDPACIKVEWSGL